MKLEFLPEARLEFFDAVDYYEQKQTGLGRRFRAEIAEICSMILEHPLLWRERNASFRRTNCPVFPY
jgi:toxin ParE1/3/4